MKTQRVKRLLSVLLALCLVFSVLPLSSPASAASPTVSIVSYARGVSSNLRSSELLYAKVEGYSGNPANLRYTWTNNLGTYISAYNTHNMYAVSLGLSNYIFSGDSKTGTGYAYAAVGGNDLGGWTGLPLLSDYDDYYKLRGSLTVTVRDAAGNLIAKSTYQGPFLPPDIKADLQDSALGLFVGDSATVKDLLGQASLVHITCDNAVVSNGVITSGADCVRYNSKDSSVTGLKKGVATLSMTVSKTDNCDFHAGQSASASVKVYVFVKPTTSTTSTTLTLSNLDPDCDYFLEGVQGVVDPQTNTITFTGLTPSTDYTVEVRASYQDSDGVHYVYAYVSDTTKPLANVTVSYDLNGGVGADGVSYADETVASGTSVTLKDAPTKENYAFVGWSDGTNTYDAGKLLTVTGNVTLTAQWKLDQVGGGEDGKEPDGIPDEYQKKITFRVVNGIWADNTSKDIITYVTLLDANGKWSAAGTAALTAPTGMTANYGYEGGAWDVTPPAEVSGTTAETYTYRFTKIADPVVDYDKPVPDDEPEHTQDEVPYGALILVDPNGGSWTHDGTTYTTAQEFKLEENFSIAAATREGYVFMGWEVSSTDRYARVYTAQWKLDQVGGGEDGKEPDGIPDEYQKKITFRVVNGVWADNTSKDIITYVTLLDANGKWSAAGTAALTTPTGMTANYGYEGGAWDVTPPAEVSGTTAETYTYRFTKIADPVVDYDKPVPDGEPEHTQDEVPYGALILVDPNGGSWTHDGTTYTAAQEFKLEENFSIAAATREGYVFMGWEAGSTDRYARVYTAQWEQDSNNDGIPDKYQVTVTFHVENGTWSDGTTDAITLWLTLLDENGKWSEAGSAALTAPTGMKPNYGFGNGAWDVTLPTAVTLDGEKDFTYRFAPLPDPIVDYDKPVPDGEPEHTQDEIPYGQSILVDPNGGTWTHDGTTYTTAQEFKLEENFSIAAATREGYVFMGWAVSESEEYARIYTAQWEQDSNNDGIPDKYQVTVTFHVENGTWSDGTTDTITLWLTLLDENGKWSETGSAALTAPTDMKPNYGFGNGAWDVTLPTTITPNSEKDFTYRFAPLPEPVIDYDRFVPDGKPEHAEDTYPYGALILVNPNGGFWTHDGETYTNAQELVLEENLSIAAATREGYVFMGWAVSESEEYARIYTAQWEQDSNNDGVPDKYQKVVTFKVVNGTWADGTTTDITLWLTLVDAHGQWSETGTAALATPTGMKAASGYEKGAWDVQPPTQVSATDASTFTYRFAKKTTPGKPTNPTNPNTPNTGDSSNLTLWYTMLSVSVLALFVLLLAAKRRKENA